MYAVIETGGKQYRVQEGDLITIEKLNLNAGDKVIFDKVLIMGEGADIQVGAPYIEGANVYGDVVENGKAKKVIIFKYKSKKDYRKKQGHRQPYTLVEITGIGEDKPKAVAETAPAEDVAEAAEDDKKAVKAPSMAMKKDELIAFASENNIEVDEKATKQVILDTIETALNK